MSFQLTKEQAIKHLVGLRYTRKEAEEVLEEKDRDKRDQITQRVQQEVKAGKR